MKATRAPSPSVVVKARFPATQLTFQVLLAKNRIMRKLIPFIGSALLLTVLLGGCAEELSDAEKKKLNETTGKAERPLEGNKVEVTNAVE